MTDNDKKLSSEEILDMEKQPDQSCTKIDQAIKDSNSILENAKEALKSLHYENYESVVEEIASIEYDASDLEDNFEYCRSQCDAIRSWGQDWKNLAKGLIKKYEPELLKLERDNNGTV